MQVTSLHTLSANVIRFVEECSNNNNTVIVYNTEVAFSMLNNAAASNFTWTYMLYTVVFLSDFRVTV